MHPYFLKISICFFILCNSAQAMSRISDGELIISLQNDLPCFSYPLDEETNKWTYLFGSLHVGWNDDVSSLPGHSAWQLALSADSSVFVSPSSSESCISYGRHYPGTQEKDGAAKPMRYDIPYEANLSVFTKDKNAGFSTRRYRSWFCFSRNETKQPIILKAIRNRSTAKFECVPPAEKGTSKGFFDRLFGTD